jgi:hypothetical protein
MPKDQKIEDRGWRIGKCRGASRAFASVYLLSSILFSPGCSAVGALTNKVVPQAPVPAAYVPAKDKPMLVLVENYRNPSAATMDAQRLTVHLADELQRYRVAPVVDAEALESLRSRDDYHAMKVQDVGRAAGAKQVLYVNLRQVNLSNTVAGEMIRGNVEMYVRVVDVASGQTLWPRDLPEGHAVTAETPWVRTGAAGAREGASEPALHEQVAVNAAHQIVKLLRNWRPDEEEQDLEETVH